MTDESVNKKDIADKLQLSLTAIMLVHIILLCLIINFGILMTVLFYLICIVYNIFSAFSKNKSAKVDFVVSIVILLITFWAAVYDYNMSTFYLKRIISMSEKTAITIIIISFIVIAILTSLLFLTRIKIAEKVKSNSERDT